jgi:hypothetical protein
MKPDDRPVILALLAVAISVLVLAMTEAAADFGDSAFNLAAARLLEPEIGTQVAIERTLTATPAGH